MPTILITTSNFDLAQQKSLVTRLSDAGYTIHLNPYGRRLTEAEIMALINDDVIGIIAGVEPLTRAVMEKANRLAVISRCGIGLDNVDLCAAKKCHINVYSTPDAPTSAVAELTIGLMLSLLRHIPQADHRLRQKKWQPQMGRLLSQQTIGLIGYGRIGRYVAHLLQAFSPKLLVHDPYSQIPSHLTACTLEDLLMQSTLISLHVPALSATSPLLNRERLMTMRQGALLVNTARGSLIDEEALYDLLKSGHLGGAALDVFAEEPYHGALTNLEKVVLTAHMGSYAQETRSQMEQEAMYNLMMGLQEKKMLPYLESQQVIV